MRFSKASDCLILITYFSTAFSKIPPLNAIFFKKENLLTFLRELMNFLGKHSLNTEWKRNNIRFYS